MNSGGLFASFGTLQFGADYANSRDNYIYGYSSEFGTSHVYLFRVLKNNIENRASYEFFSGTPNSPAWSSNIANRTPVFVDNNGTGWLDATCVYHPGFNRYLLAVTYGGEAGNWGLFDGPTPWGPWTTIAYNTDLPNWTYDQDPNGASANRPAYEHNFPQKWFSSNDAWVIYDRGDRFNMVKATFIVPPTPTPTPTPTATPSLTCSIQQKRLDRLQLRQQRLRRLARSNKKLNQRIRRLRHQLQLQACL
jgi:hypothetical protein